MLSLGVGLLLVATVVGVFTYTESNLFLGPNQAYLQALAEGDVETPWEEDLVVRLAHLIDDDHRDIEWNGRLLFVTQVGLAAGVIIVAGAVGLWGKAAKYRPMSDDDVDRSRESSRRLGQRSGKGTELLSKLLGRK